MTRLTLAIARWRYRRLLAYQRLIYAHLAAFQSQYYDSHGTNQGALRALERTRKDCETCQDSLRDLEHKYGSQRLTA